MHSLLSAMVSSGTRIPEVKARGEDRGFAALPPSVPMEPGVQQKVWAATPQVTTQRGLLGEVLHLRFSFQDSNGYATLAAQESFIGESTVSSSGLSQPSALVTGVLRSGQGPGRDPPFSAHPVPRGNFCLALSLQHIPQMIAPGCSRLGSGPRLVELFCPGKEFVVRSQARRSRGCAL